MQNISQGKQGVEGVIGRSYHGCPAETQLRFTAKGRQVNGPEAGKSWSLRLHIIGGSNPGLLFIVRLLIKLIVNTLPVAVGPNQVLTNPEPMLTLSPKLATTLS